MLKMELLDVYTMCVRCVGFLGAEKRTSMAFIRRSAAVTLCVQGWRELFSLLLKISLLLYVVYSADCWILLLGRDFVVLLYILFVVSALLCVLAALLICILSVLWRRPVHIRRP